MDKTSLATELLVWEVRIRVQFKFFKKITKIWQNVPVGMMFTKYVNEKSSGRFRQIFVAFSQYLNFIMFLAGVLHKVYGVKSFLDYSYFYPPFFSRVIPKYLKKILVKSQVH